MWSKELNIQLIYCLTINCSLFTEELKFFNDFLNIGQNLYDHFPKNIQLQHTVPGSCTTFQVIKGSWLWKS